MRPTGIFVVIILLTVGGFSLLVYLGSLDRRSKVGNGQYDERQLRARGKGFELGFYAMVLAGVCFYLAESTFDRELALPGVAPLMTVCLGVTVMSVYSIVKDAFVAIRGSRAVILVSMGLVAAWEIFYGLTLMRDEGTLSEGRLGRCWMYLSFGMMAASIFLSLLIKVLLDRRNRE